MPRKTSCGHCRRHDEWLFDEEASSGFVTVEWQLRNPMMVKKSWSRVVVSSTFAFGKSSYTESNSGDDEDPHLIGNAPLSNGRRNYHRGE